MSRDVVSRLRALPQGVRFLIAGGGAAGVSWLVRFPLSAFMPFPAAVLAAAVIGMSIGFVAYRDFVFPGSGRPTSRQLADFLLVNATTSLAVAALAYLAAPVIAAVIPTRAAEAAAHALGIAFGAVLNFFGHHALTFRQTRPPAGSRAKAGLVTGAEPGSVPVHATLLLAACLAGSVLVVYEALIGRASDDTDLWFLPWMEQVIALGPIRSLTVGFANYTPPLLYLFSLASLAHPWASPLLLIKLVSVVGSLCCAASVYGLLRIFRSGQVAVLGALAVLLLPTVALNGAAWGQSDAFYTAALVACVAAALRRQSTTALIAFGVAVGFKLQAAFLGPFLLHVLIVQRVPIWKALIAPAVYGALMLPAWLAGRPAGELVAVYLDQAGLFRALSMNAPNPWSFVQRTGLPYELGVALGFGAAALAGLALALRRPLDLSGTLLLAVTSAVAMPFLLPKMHDRYFFVADVLAFVLALAVPRAWTLAAAVLIQLGSLGAYAAYLFGLKGGTYLGALAMAAALILLLAHLAPAEARCAERAGWMRRRRAFTVRTKLAGPAG